MNGPSSAEACAVCDRNDSLLFHCERCGDSHCQTHRDEADHACDGTAEEAAHEAVASGPGSRCSHCGSSGFLFGCQECGRAYCLDHRALGDHACEDVADGQASQSAPTPSTTGEAPSADASSDSGRYPVSRRGFVLLASTVVASGATALQLGQPDESQAEAGSSGLEDIRWGYGGSPVAAAEDGGGSGTGGIGGTDPTETADSGGSVTSEENSNGSTPTAVPTPTPTPATTTERSPATSTEGQNAGGGNSGGSGSGSGGSSSGGGSGGGSSNDGSGASSGGSESTPTATETQTATSTSTPTATETQTATPTSTPTPTTTAGGTPADEYGQQGYGEAGYGG